MTRTRLLPTAGLAGLLAVALTTAAERGSAGDFDVGIPDDRVDGVRAAGAVLVTYSTADGVLGGRSQLWTQNAPGLKGLAGEFHRFGASLAGGDLDGDGEADLAIGIPGGTIQGHGAAGAVTVRGTDEMVSQASGGVKGAPEDGDHFGRSLATGDYDGDREADLAVGAPLEDVGDHFDAGAVGVLYGSENGGINRRDDFWSQGSRGIKGTVQALDNFGRDVAAGDFDGDRRWDLVAAAPHDSVQGFPEAGAVNVIYGHRGGLREDADELWTQGTRGIKGAVGSDRFGTALGSGAPGG